MAKTVLRGNASIVGGLGLAAVLALMAPAAQEIRGVAAPKAPLPAAAPKPPLPAQQAVIDALAPLVINHTVVCDDNGNVIKFAVSNHTAFIKDKSKPVPSGIDDAAFARILELPHLQAIALEMQPLSNEGYARIGKLKQLRDVRLHYIGKNPPKNGTVDKDAPLFINDLPLPLEVLEIKHCFAIKGGCMDKLKPQPELKKLEIDTGYATSDAVGFIKNSPKIENLQIHRTTMTDRDLQDIFAALPNLKVLLLRPTAQGQNKDNRITGKSLRGLAKCPELRLLILGIQWGEMPFEGGLDALVGLRKLKTLDLAISDIKDFSIQDPAIQKLHQTRPDILIKVGDKTLGGAEGQQREKEDAEWNWDNGVTTHG